VSAASFTNPTQNNPTRAVTVPANTDAPKAESGEPKVCATKRYVSSANGNDNVSGATVNNVRGAARRPYENKSYEHSRTHSSPSALYFFLLCVTLASTLAVKAFARRALGMKASPVNPEYTRAYLLNAMVTPSRYPTANRIPLIRKNALGGIYAGSRPRKIARRVKPRMIVRIEADKQIVPRDEPVERTTAAWMVWVDIGDGGIAS